MWALVDIAGRVQSLNAGSMDGCTDWQSVNTRLTVDDALCDGNGVALYKVEDGKVVKRTKAEIAADTPAPAEPSVSIDERVSEIQGQISLLLSEMEAALNGE